MDMLISVILLIVFIWLTLKIVPTLFGFTFSIILTILQILGMLLLVPIIGLAFFVFDVFIIAIILIIAKVIFRF